MADRLQLDFNKIIEEAESHHNDQVEALNLFINRRFSDWIVAILTDYDYYTSKELTPRISEKLIQLNDFKKFNDEITPLEDDEQENPVKTRNITGKAINIADCPYLVIVDIDIDKKLSEQERNFQIFETSEIIAQFDKQQSFEMDMESLVYESISLNRIIIQSRLVKTSQQVEFIILDLSQLRNIFLLADLPSLDFLILKLIFDTSND
ncbi:MAG: hypothetical protein EZS28_004830 [Streblomastix strix]|uniref:Uncharacterized protein n=1 Tax=Streblomastix strix TaxID=222440 RepID=A0A5J4WX59_9EUKA|nr:MAG: hypothetical protein EZS28_004830 [Streblomastix strix]